MKNNTYRIVGLIAIIGAMSYVITMPSTTVYERATSTPDIAFNAPVSALDDAKKQLEEATAKLNAEEEAILRDRDNASTTASIQIAELQKRIADVEAQRDAQFQALDDRIDAINEIRSSF